VPTNEAFVYCWTDRLTNKLYVGWHKGQPDDGYICSSKIMLQEYKNRSSDFTRQVLASGNMTDMINFETKILIAFNAAKDKMFYNMHNGNGNFYLKCHTEESKNKISIGKTGKLRPDLSERNRLDSNPAKLGLCGRDTSGKKNPMYAKKHSAESIAKMRSNRKGLGTGPLSEETKKKMSDAKKLYWLKRKGLV
jgi:hypothetical protein